MFMGEVVPENMENTKKKKRKRWSAKRQKQQNHWILKISTENPVKSSAQTSTANQQQPQKCPSQPANQPAMK